MSEDSGTTVWTIVRKNCSRAKSKQKLDSGRGFICSKKSETYLPPSRGNWPVDEAPLVWAPASGHELECNGNLQLLVELVC